MQDFLLQFAPMEFILGELGNQLPHQEVTTPVIFLAGFHDNIYFLWLI